MGAPEFRTAALLAAVGSAIPLVYPQSYYLAMTLRQVSQAYPLVVAFRQFLPPLAVALFMAYVCAEAFGVVREHTRRRVSGMAAVIMALGMVLFIVETAAGRALRAAAPFWFPLYLLGILLVTELIPRALWLALFVVFAREPAPVRVRRTSKLAGVMLAFTILQGVLLIYDSRFFPFKSTLWTLFGWPALRLFGWLSTLLFLWALWRSPVPPEPELV